MTVTQQKKKYNEGEERGTNKTIRLLCIKRQRLENPKGKRQMKRGQREEKGG